VSSTGFQANWNASSGATGYRLDVSTGSGFASYVAGYQDLTVSGLSQAVSGLTASTPYYYRVRAVGAGGTSGNSNTITVTTSAAGGQQFAVVVIGDTQEYYGGSSSASIGNGEMAWVANNRAAHNIVALTTVGDITETGASSEYTQASAAYAQIENPTTTGLPDGIPWVPLMGNHDATSGFNTAFPISRFSGRGYYGGHYGSDMTNNAVLFSGGGRDFILVGLSHYPTSAEMTWAHDLIASYPTRLALVSTHGLLNDGGTQGSASWDYQALYTALRDLPNLRMMYCGHMHDGSGTADGEQRRSDTYNGNTVHSIISDYQDRTAPGFVRLYYFDPANNKVRARTYSTVNGTYEADSDSSSQFTLTVNFTITPPPPAPQAVSAPARPEAALADFALLGTVAGVPSGTTASWLWEGLDPLTEYEWYVTVSDGQASPVTGPTWSFTTAAASSGVGDWGYGGLALAPPAPNPTRGALRFSFDLPRAMHARLEVLDVQGRVVAALAEGDFGAGRQERVWDATARGGPAGAGVYFVRLVTPEGRLVRRVALLR
jgi:hypothetical protein